MEHLVIEGEIVEGSFDFGRLFRSQLEFLLEMRKRLTLGGIFPAGGDLLGGDGLGDELIDDGAGKCAAAEDEKQGEYDLGIFPSGL